MKLYELKISEITNLLESNKPTQYLYNLIHNYFDSYISDKKVCSESELKELDLFLEKINSSAIFGEKEKNSILLKVGKLYVLSKDKNQFDEFLELSKKKIGKFIEDEILRYFDILINSCPSCIHTIELMRFMQMYLGNYDHNDKLFNLLCNNSNLLSVMELKCLSSVILKEIIRELDNEIISSKKIECYLEQLCKIKLEDVSSKIIMQLCDILKNISNNEVVFKFDDIESFRELKNKIDDIFDDVVNNLDCDAKIKSKFVAGKIKLSNAFPKGIISNINLDFDYLPILDGERIITIDDLFSPDLDGAFSIRKIDGVYNLNVYISDVPVFLMKNRDLCHAAYLRGTSMYVRESNNRGNYNIDMLPPFLSHKHLSLNLGYPKNVIVFNFVIGENGEIYSRSVDRRKIIVTDKLSTMKAKTIIESDEYYGSLQRDLRNYQDLCRVVSSKATDEYLKNLNYRGIYDLVGFSSILVNYFVGYEAEFAIYRGKGFYTRDNSSHYTHSATPVRRFVSNINLAFFLEQNGVVNFSSQDLKCVENNVEEIIKHLNEREEIGKFVDRNSKFVKKYLK